MKVLVINSGSSSIKYQLFDMEDKAVLAVGLLEQIGEKASRLKHETRQKDGEMQTLVQKDPVADHIQGFDKIMDAFAATGALKDSDVLYGIGHRVVHGGEAFHEPTLITERVIETIREQIPLAPLHNPPNLLGIEVTVARRPEIPQVAVFDTAFHQTIPSHAYWYALPYDLANSLHIRRYGFHGTSHQYVSKAAARHLQRPLDELNLITCHLGNGASICAVRDGKSVDTSMGMTPLEGLIMGTRSGDIDPAVVFYLNRKTGRSVEDIDTLLNKESGMKGICGVNDMREIEELATAGDARARLALDMYCYRLKKYIGAYAAVLGRVDALVFTAGVGENSDLIRARACENLSSLGIILDEQKNKEKKSGLLEVQTENSPVRVLVIPTNEELEIAEQTVSCIQRKKNL
ncbi:MAG: acetate kinase [Candidatus Aminicenantes bacterium]|jgi:acetate kinase